MMDSSGEIITGPKVKEVLRSLLLSGQMCKLEVFLTPYCGRPQEPKSSFRQIWGRMKKGG